MRTFIKRHTLLSLLLLYFVVRLIHLTLLPIFNDEAIYIDWGLRGVHLGDMYYPLTDGKQPLLMWLFGIVDSVWFDQLAATRFVSVLFGAGTMLGLYRIGKTYFSDRVGMVAAILYIGIPIFAFFDRQALMEGAIACIGVWSCWYLLRLLEQERTRDAILLGVVLGLGYFIKSTALLFIAVSLVLLLVHAFRVRKPRFWQRILLSFVSFVAVTFLLFINPVFWMTLSKNSRYSLTIPELLHFPLLHWLETVWISVQISFFYLTPFVFLAVLAGCYVLFSQKEVRRKQVLYFALGALLLQVLVVRSETQRYLVSFLPLVLLPAISVVDSMRKKYPSFSLAGLSILLIIPYALTLLEVFSPVSYFAFYNGLTPYSDQDGYITSNTSGYGVAETLAYLKKLSEQGPMVVGYASNAGNPESAVRAAFYLTDVKTGSLDASLLGNELNGVDCLQSSAPIYFVSRDEQQAGLNKYLANVTFFKNPYGMNKIGIYRLKTNCQGKTKTLDYFSQGS